MADFPDIEPDLEEIGLIANNQVYDSILTGQVQTASLSGAKWTCAPTFSNRNGKEARDLRAFIFGQNGVSGRFNYYPASIDNAGTHSGLGVVDGAGQTGSTLETKDWDADQPLLFAAGDYITANGEMKMVTADVPVGQDYIEYDETNYMPSPFDPVSWSTADPDGTKSNIALANPSGNSVVGDFNIISGNYTFITTVSSFNASIGEKIYLCFIVKNVSADNVFIRFQSDSGIEDQTQVSLTTLTKVVGGSDILVTSLSDGFSLLQVERVASANLVNADILVYANGDGGQFYAQAAFFGKANDWPAKLRANATIPITPPMRTSPADGALIEANNPYFQGRLESDDMSRLQVSSPVIYNTTLSIVEAF